MIGLALLGVGRSSRGWRPPWLSCSASAAGCRRDALDAEPEDMTGAWLMAATW